MPAAMTAPPLAHVVAPEPALGGEAADPDDVRLRHLFRPFGERAGSLDLALVGVPTDDGIVVNGGRPGAALGPSALRRALLRFGTAWDAHGERDLSTLSLADVGDVAVVSGDVRATHARAQGVIAAALERARVVAVVGGGNDITFASAAALLATAPGGITAVNVDAHLDVRPVVGPQPGSGTPYRRLVEELGVPGTHVIELGLHAHVNARAHFAWARAQGLECWTLARARDAGSPAVVLRRALREREASSAAALVSIDLDVFGAAFAPGVSAAGTEGMTPEEGLTLARAAGEHPRVRVFELVELSPPNDVDHRTARLAAALLAAFIGGLAARG